MSYYLHKMELATRHTVIAIDENEKPVPTYTYLNGEPIIYSDGERVPNKQSWTLGPVETEKEANNLALALAEYYACDVMSDGKLLGLPYMGEPGEWVSRSEAAAALGHIKSGKKAAANRDPSKANKPPKEGKKPRGWQKGVPRKKKSESGDAN